MAKIISNVATTETFSAWLDKTNQLASSFANVVSVDSTNPATFPQGTAGVNGVLIANTLTVTTGLLTANASANIVGSANVTVAVNVGANVTANTSALKVGNSTVNSIITSTTASVGSNVVANTSALLIGNSSVNTVITSSSIDTDGSLSVLGATSISNTLGAGNTTITGFANVSSTLAAGDTTINGFINVSSTANVGGAVNLRSTLAVNGAVTVPNTAALGNTTVTGFINVSTTANVGGATNLRGDATVDGALTVVNTAAVGNTTVTGFINVSTTANVGGATNLRSTLVVNGAVTIANTLSSGITSTANLSVTGFANVSSTLAAGNTTITGFANVSTTANVGGATNLRSTLDVVGATAITNTLSAGNTTVANLTVSGVINRNPTITLGGDLTGSVTLTDLQNGTLTATIAADSVALGTDTTGNYVANVAGANGISSIAVGVGKINGSTTTITAGDGLTVFQRDLNIGSIIQVSNNSTSEIRSVTAIESNTSMTVNAAFNTALVNASSNIVYSVVNPTGEGSIPTIRVVPNTGIVANADGVFVNSAYIATISANNASHLNGELPAYYTNATNISTGTLAVARGGTGVGTSTGTGSVVLSASPTFTGNAGFANIALTGVINANNSIGSAGQVLRTDGEGKAYWGPAVTAEDGTLTDINAGVGLVKGGTSTVPSLAVVANNGIIASTDGVFVKSHTGIIVNTDGVSVNAAYIATISANNASNFGGQLPAYYTNATNISTGTLAVARGGTGATTFTSGGLLRGNGTSAVSVASAADIVAAIGTTRVANATYADSSGSAGSATTATRATNSDNALVTNDNASFGTFYPVWVDATAGDRAIKTSSTKLNFNPSTGILTATGFSGNGASLTSISAENISTGTLPVGRGGTGVTTANGTGSVVLSASPTLTGTPAAPTAAVDTNSSQIATTAYVIGQGYLKSGTAASTYLPLAGGTVTGNLTVSGNLTIDGTTTNINTTNLVVEDKNIILGDVTTPSNTTADGGGITLNGATNKTLNWVNATGAWTSSEDFNLLTGKAYYINGSLVLSSTSLAVGANVSANVTAFFVGNSTVNTFITQNLLDIGGQLNANGGVGTAGQVLVSGGAGNVYWTNQVVDTNTTYDLLGVANTQANQGILRLVPLSGTDDDVFFVGQDDIVVSSITGTIQIDHADITRTNNTSTASPASGGTFTAIDSISTNARGHVTAINTKTVTLPVDPDTNTTYDLATVANTVANEGLINLIGSNLTTDTGKIIGQDEIVVSSNPTAVYIDHADVARSNNTSTASPASGGTFTVIDSITTNARGHVTAINTKTVTLPPELDTTYDLLTVANTTQGVVRLASSGNANDNINFVGAGGVTVTSDASGAVTITGQVGDITAVTAGDGLTGGGTSGDVTLNVGAGDGITVNPDNIAVNTTVVRTTGDQTIGGTKNFSNTVLLANSGFMFSSDGSQDTGINWASDGVMNVRSNGVTIGQFNGSGFTGNAGTVTNGVYTTGDQTIGGTKTFSSTISGSINGNAGTATKASTVNNTKNSGAISMWTGTLAEYNAIGTKDSTTLYFVT